MIHINLSFVLHPGPPPNRYPNTPWFANRGKEKIPANPFHPTPRRPPSNQGQMKLPPPPPAPLPTHITPTHNKGRKKTIKNICIISNLTTYPYNKSIDEAPYRKIPPCCKKKKKFKNLKKKSSFCPSHHLFVKFVVVER